MLDQKPLSLLIYHIQIQILYYLSIDSILLILQIISQFLGASARMFGNSDQYNQNGYPNFNSYSNPNQPYNQSYNQGSYPNNNFFQGSTNNYANQDDNFNEGYNNDYDKSPGLESNARNGFIKKVYSLLSLQLLVTALVCVWAMNSQTFKNIFVNTPMIIVVSVSLIVVSFVVACCQETMRKYGLPILIVFTLLESILVGIICSMTKSEIVLTAFGITAVLVIGLTAYACLTKTDLTGCGPYLFVLCLLLLVFGIILIFWRNPIAHLIYSCLATLLFSVFLIFDTQMILGKFENSYSLDDAYIATIQLYIDIIQIFLNIVQILGFIDG